MNTQPRERNQEATCYVGNLDDRVTDELLWELFLQAGPVVNVHMPKDRVTGSHQNYGFVEFLGEEDAEYALKILNAINLYGKPIRVSKASANKNVQDVGANIFVSGLAAEVDEKLLHDTFSAFGVLLRPPKLMRDPDTGATKGFAFINYATFESSDAAIRAMDGQFLCNKTISVKYALKKDSTTERHGSAAERLHAAQAPVFKTDAAPHMRFADPASMGRAPPMPPMGMPPPMPNMPPPLGMPPHMMMAPGMMQPPMPGYYPPRPDGMPQPPMPPMPPMPAGQPPMPAGQPPMPAGQPPMPAGQPPMPPMPPGPPPPTTGAPPPPPPATGAPAAPSLALSGEEAYLARMRMSQPR